MLELEEILLKTTEDSLSLEKLVESENVERVDNDIIFKNINFGDVKIDLSNNLIFSKSNLNIGFFQIGNKYLNEENQKFNYKKLIFCECKINSLIFSGSTNLELSIEKCEINELKFFNIFYSQRQGEISPNSVKNFEITKSTIKLLDIKKCKFAGKFYINPQNRNYSDSKCINEIKIIDSTFEKNFKLHNVVNEKFEIDNVDFNANADFYKSKFLSKGRECIVFNGINFKKLALFGDTEFHMKLIFQYVTFESHNHFKSCLLKNGIDLEYTNIQKEINFYGIVLKNVDNTSQETYRIIKSQFDKLGNRIEANLYHSYELEQRNRNLSYFSPNKWALIIHKYSSYYSQYWLLPLFWILVVSYLTNLYLDYEKFNFLTNLFNWNLNELKIELKDLIKYSSIVNFDKSFSEEHVEAFVFNKISLGYLYYQLVTAVRKDTRK